MTQPAASDEAALFKHLIRSRRTVHEFSTQPVPDASVEAALDLLRWAPNHHRTEPWRVYRLGPSAQRRIAELNADMVRANRGERAAAVKLKRWLAMPGWLLMTCTTSDDGLRQQEDYAACCCAAQNMTLALWADGIGAKWTTGDVVRHSEFPEIVGFSPENEFVVGLFWYGYPAAVAEQQRRPPDDYVTDVG
ncbi:MAG: nitroreductase family protein [Gammaproteobacteria bacterium]